MEQGCLLFVACFVLSFFLHFLGLFGVWLWVMLVLIALLSCSVEAWRCCCLLSCSPVAFGCVIAPCLSFQIIAGLCSISDLFKMFAKKQEIGYPILQTGLSECLGNVNIGTSITSSPFKSSWPRERSQGCAVCSPASGSPVSAICNWQLGSLPPLCPRSLGGYPELHHACISPAL